VYLETDAPGGIVIRALSIHNGSQRWSRTFSSGDGYFPSLGDVANGVVYAADDNELLALDATTGRLLWQQPFDANQTFLPPVIMDGVLYDNAYGAENGPSAVYAINPANGRELWQTGEFGPTASTLNETIATEANGLVYYGSVDGSIYAVSARNGAPVWNTSMKYAVNAAPVVVNGVVYVGGAPENGVDPNTYPGEVLALDAATGKQLWSYVLPSVGYDGVYPLIAAGGVIYVETGTGYIYTVNSTTGSQVTQIQVGADCGTSTDPALTLIV
jgi:outer membrane protein assembly factor BamB